MTVLKYCILFKTFTKIKIFLKRWKNIWSLYMNFSHHVLGERLRVIHADKMLFKWSPGWLWGRTFISSSLWLQYQWEWSSMIICRDFIFASIVSLRILSPLLSLFPSPQPLTSLYIYLCLPAKFIFGAWARCHFYYLLPQCHALRVLVSVFVTWSPKMPRYLHTRVHTHTLLTISTGKSIDSLCNNSNLCRMN